MLKLIVSDLDGTLLPKGSKMPDDEVFDMLALLKEKNISFAVASGRAYYELKRFFRGAADEIYYLASDGALTVFGGENLREKAIPKPLLYRAFAKAKQKRVSAAVFTGKYLSYYVSAEPGFVQSFHRERNHHVLPTESVLEITEPIFKISFYNAEANELSDLAFDLSLVYRDGHWTDFIRKDADKGSTLQALCRELKISEEEVMVFGDNDNDVSMLRLTPNSCAMESGSEAARKAANMRTDSVTKMLKALLG